MTGRALAAAVAALTLTACATSHVLVGKVRPAVPPSQVHVYLQPLDGHYEEIAIIEASSKRSFAFTKQGKADAVLDRLKIEAAKLGANGILLQEITDETDGTFDTGVGHEWSGARGTVDLSLVESSFLSHRVGRGTAIYVSPQPTVR